MPEVDTLWQAAARLHAALADQVVVRFASPRPELKEREVEGRRIVRVRVDSFLPRHAAHFGHWQNLVRRPARARPSIE